MTASVQQIGNRIQRHGWAPRPEADLASFSSSSRRQPGRRGAKSLRGGSRPLGDGIEWHDFTLDSAGEWTRHLPAQSLELCLNLAGQGTVSGAEASLEFQPLTAGFYLSGKGGLRAWRRPGQQHQFLTVVFPARFLREHLAGCDGALHPVVERFLEGGGAHAGVGTIHRLGTSQEQDLARWLHPPCPQAARLLWYQSRVLALMTEFFFERPEESELLCDRQKRVARERVERVIGLLRQQLAEPPSLEEIGRQVGCSPFHLSRTFSAEMGTTIPQYLRKLRMERAAELLRSGQCNVTEAALEVGYSSISHFSQAFCQTMGCCPSIYPLQQPL